MKKENVGIEVEEREVGIEVESVVDREEGRKVGSFGDNEGRELAWREDGKWGGLKIERFLIL